MITLTIIRSAHPQPSALILVLRASYDFSLEAADDLARTGGRVTVPEQAVEAFAFDCKRCGYLVVVSS